MPEKGHVGVSPNRGAGAAPRGRGTAPQDGRPRAVPSRVGSYALSAGGRCSGQYAAVRAWDGLAAWLSELLEWSESPEGKATRDAHGHISVRRFMAVAQAEGETADARTGREVTTSHETAALRATEILGQRVSRGVAIRARRVMEAAGFSVTVAEGRYLFTHERQEAQEAHGQVQRRAASVRALTHPTKRRRFVSVNEIEHLPRRGGVNTLSHVKRNSPTHAQARAQAATRPRHSRKNDRRRANAHHSGHRYSTSTLRLASALTGLPFLSSWRGVIGDGDRMRIVPNARHIGGVCNVIAASGIDTERWTFEDVRDVLAQLGREGLPTLDGNQVENPLGYLATLLRRVIGYASVTGWRTAAEREQDRQRRVIERARQASELRAERAARQARLSDPAEQAAIAAILAEMKSKYSTTDTHKAVTEHTDA